MGQTIDCPFTNLLGALLGAKLPKHHLIEHNKEVVRLALALVGMRHRRPVQLHLYLLRWNSSSGL